MSFLFKKWGNKRNSLDPTNVTHDQTHHGSRDNTNISNNSPSHSKPSTPPQVIKSKHSSTLDEDEFVNVEKSPRNNNDSNLTPLVPVSTSPLHEPVLDTDETLYNNWLENDSKKNKTKESPTSNKQNTTSNQTTTSSNSNNNNLSQRLTSKDVQKYTTHNPNNTTITISNNSSQQNKPSSRPQSPRSSSNPQPVVKPQVVPQPPPPPPQPKPKPPKSTSYVCPICNTILYTSDEVAVSFHIDDCLARSMNATNVSNPPKKSTPSQPKNRPRDDDSPFLIACPYLGCGQRMEARYFYNHAILQHSTAPQAYACPICFLAGIQFAPRSDTNLLTHLQNTHSDLAAVSQPPPSTQQPANPQSYDDDDDFEEYDPAAFLVDEQDNPPTLTPDVKSLGYKYVEDVMKDAKPGVECTICFEEFENGDVIARMDCFCVFHKKCIELWFKKANKCPLHKD